MRLSILFCIALACISGCDVHAACERASLSPLSTEPTFAVVTSDFASTAIALLDGNGELLTEAWLDSGTKAPVLSSSLSGDVVLPTMHIKDGMLTLIDRFGVDVVTFISIPDGQSIQQFATTLPMQHGETAFRANPQDALRWSDSLLAVSRSEPNLDSAAPELDRGNDVVLIDSESGALVRRISLDALNVPHGDNPVYARPNRMIRVGDGILVGLARLSADFRIGGAGAAALLHPDTDEMVAIELEGLRNCMEVTPVFSDNRRAIVMCAGDTFTNVEGRRAHSGMARIFVDEAEAPHIEAVWRSRDHQEAPAITHGAISLDKDRVVVVAMGDLKEGKNDELVMINLETGQATSLWQASRPFALGPGTLDRGLLLVPDAFTGVVRFRMGESMPEFLSTVDSSPCRRLGAREIRRL